MFDDLMGAYGSRFLLAAGGVGIALLLLIVVLWIMRSRAPSPFVRGGRNRQPRLQVLDAAAVDARRRLVLVRRDDVEHLIMIGGPTDIVIESRIGEPVDKLVSPETADQSASAPAPVPVPVIPPQLEATPEAPAPVRIAPAEPQHAPPAHIHTPVEPYVPERAPIEARPEPAIVATPPSTPPVIAERERAPRPAPSFEPRPEPRQTRAPIEASVAADILDSARQRVLPQQRIEPQATPPSVRSTPAPVQPSSAFVEVGTLTPAAQPSDFQRILEEEMTSTLAAERIVPAPQAPAARPAPPPGNLPRRDPEMAPLTGADAALQNEVARIFGEMSVNRDK
ncbi:MULTISPECIES: flagellar biosynthetic protein FliO [unclassified Rhizobium]|uniref:flagellar biosynthetic protein FliO n=1 Tax=unclassified Rhizobium TaxID=2613769 RepID=UPI00104E8D6C|nr:MULTISPECIES: flagellar biosynthetic protein FliO [unclassified Rhizobium]MBB3399279.1 flagellar biogenesis protein FliO [Rhizobium sp. BK060]MBB4171126.1 flagellar biogenesis protein FliO [Rhizobium sp. BK538]TCM69729.1 flagellar biosynthesis protein FliO [Rhizobium sp. BK068]